MKILIVNNNMQIGGIQKSLVNLLSVISDEHEITLMLFNKSGELLEDIPKKVEIVNGNCFTRILGMSQSEAKKNGVLTYLWRSLWVILTRVFGIKLSFGLLCRMQKAEGEYDAVISFMQNSAYRLFYGGCNEFAVKSVRAKRKLAFVHCDFEKYYGNNAYNVGFYDNFDGIACVSDSVQDIFVRACPKCGDKVFTVHNAYNFEKMAEQAAEYEVKSKSDCINIFTSARISEEKGIMRMIPIFADIKRVGGNFIWRIAGDGPMMNEAIEAVKNYELEADIEFLGMLKNPYPYFKHSDMLLVPSYNEAAPMVFGEALFFKTPVFTAETSSASELVGEDGWIAENSDRAIKESLLKLILNPDEILQKQISANLSNDRTIIEFNNALGAEVRE